MSELASSLRLIRSENVGPRTFYSLVKKFGSPQNALDRLPEIASKGGKREIKICPIDVAKKEIEATEKLGIKTVIFSDVEYPENLKLTYGAPPVLFYKGDLELLKKDSIGVVGTRNASANGCAITRKLCAELGEQSFVVISGLARGIDSEAHKASLQTGTIAVVASGLDSVYPPENENLFKQIEERGLILAENPIGTQPQARHFPQRNRVIAGLSKGLLVVEAAKKSGSLITVDFALRENREVFAVPGSPLDPRCSGTNYLIKNGAVLVETANDITENLGSRIAPQLFEIADEFESEQEPGLPSTEAVRDDVIGKLSTSPVEIDDIARITELPISVVNEVLLELEIAGKIERQWGNKVALKAA